MQRVLEKDDAKGMNAGHCSRLVAVLNLNVFEYIFLKVSLTINFGCCSASLTSLSALLSNGITSTTKWH